MTTLVQPLINEAAVTPATSIVGIGTAVPALRVAQSEVLDFILKRFDIGDGARELYRRSMRGDAILTRHFALSSLEECLETDLNKVIARFETAAVELSTRSLTRALTASGAEPSSIDFLAVATCTGYLCPGLSAYVVERAGLRSDVRLADIVGMGCGAALPALEQASNFARANPDSTAAVICTEICSAAMYSNEDPGIIVSNAIFADGSAAILLRSAGLASNGRTLARVRSFATETRPAWRDSLRFKTDGGRLKNVLERSVPEQAGEALATVISRLLAEGSLKMADIDHWVLHAGGSRVLDAAERTLNLSPSALSPARSILRDFGNMSSPTVLFVLAQSLRAGPEPGSRAVMASFGAGFSAHAALLEF
jgi:predicted naringenin-chalcone synthase